MYASGSSLHALPSRIIVVAPKCQSLLLSMPITMMHEEGPLCLCQNQILMHVCFKHQLACLSQQRNSGCPAGSNDVGFGSKRHDERAEPVKQNYMVACSGHGLAVLLKS